MLGHPVEITEIWYELLIPTLLSVEALIRTGQFIDYGARYTGWREI